MPTNSNAPPENRFLRKYDSTETLSASADSGCALCLMIQHSHAKTHQTNERIQGKMEGDYKSHSEIKLFQRSNDEVLLETNIVWRCREESSRESRSTGGSLGGFFAISEEASKYIPGRPTQAEPSIALGKSWLQNCERNHERCPRGREVQMPTRIIDVGEEDAKGDNVTEPRLHIPAPEAEGQYAALSYCCWGSSQNVVLTLATLQAKREAIPYATLPQTIADAVKITRRLGVKYLWVDALCIIQDSATDWERESANMGNIYNKATITIQASDAATSAEGCLHMRRKPEFPHPCLKLQLPDGRLDSVFVRDESVVDLWSKEPLSQRGWTLQEGLLAARILRFDRNQMWWECRTAYHSEGGSRLEEHDLGMSLLSKPFRTRCKKRFIPENIKDTATRARLAWALIVDDYTSRRISYPKDKLEAISDLADLVQRSRPGDKYLAGLWRSEMPLSLLWGSLNGKRHPGPWRAPSWSWASLDCETTILSIDLSSKILAEVLEASVQQLGLNPVGQVASGMIKIRGPLKQAWRILEERGDPTVQILVESDRNLDPAIPTFKQKIGLCEVDVFEPLQQVLKPISVWCLRVTEDIGLALKPNQ